MGQRGWKHEANKLLSIGAFSLGVEAELLPLLLELMAPWWWIWRDFGNVLQNLLQSLDQDHRELKKALLALLTVDTTTFCRRLKVAQAPGELTDLATRLALFPFYGEQSW